MAVTLNPSVFNNNPVEEAVDERRSGQEKTAGDG